MMLPLPLAAEAPDPMNHVLRHDLFHVGPVAVSNQMFMAAVAGVLMLLIFPSLFRRARADAPHGGRNFFEAILEFLRVEVFRPALKEHTDRFVPLLWSLFFFILFCNLLGQIPVDEIISIFRGGAPSHIWGTATGTPLTTGALAVLVFIVIHVSGVRQAAKSLMDGTYAHPGPHEEHSPAGHTPAHEAPHALAHMRGDALPAD